MTGIEERILNPGVLLTMALAGLGYARVLWSLNLRPTGALVITALAPGAVFLVTLWSIRAIQGSPSPFYVYLVVDWLIFAGSALAASLTARRRHP